MLIHFGVIPYMVFDGDYLPSKALTEGERAKRRDESRKLGLELHRLGKPSQAHLELQKAVDVTPEMARQLIEELKKLGVRYVVAPYEADAQLAYLERNRVIQGIISEDSDLLVFGAKCLLTKLDQYGDCVEINRNDFTACREISLVGWTDAEFRRMAILSGCDYLTNINKMGLKTAYRLVRKHKTIEKILRMLQFDGQYHVPAGYLEAFKKAELTFLHQRVFCPLVNDIVMNTSTGIHDEPKDFEFIGKAIDQDVARGVAKGDLHPMTKEPIVVERTSRSLPKTPWGKTLKQALTTPDLKANKSIETFFKAKRTPLAELDPNSFTPSPSQQRLARPVNGSWVSNLARAPPTLPHSSASMPSSILTSNIGSLPTSSVGSSTPHPQKRRRLCVEPGEERQLPQALAQEDMQRSRFFAPSMSDPSPSLKDNRKNRGKGKEINIWSDDSVEDVMAEFPDVSDCSVPGKTGKLKIFKDEERGPRRDHPRAVHRDNSSTCEDPQSSRASTVSLKSGITTTSTTSAPASTSDGIVTSKSAALSEKLSHQPVSETRPPQRHGDAHKVKPMEYQKMLRQKSFIRSPQNTADTIPSVSNIRNEHITVETVAPIDGVSSQPLPEPHPAQRIAGEHKVKPGEYQNLLRNKTKPPFLRQGSMTPLQRLGAGALNRTQSCLASLGSSLGSSMSDPKELTQPCTDQARTNFLSESVTISKSPSNTCLTFLSAQGSEDAMVPNSEEEPEDVFSESELEELLETPKLNIGRFAFSG